VPWWRRQRHHTEGRCCRPQPRPPAPKRQRCCGLAGNYATVDCPFCWGCSSWLFSGASTNCPWDTVRTLRTIAPIPGNSAMLAVVGSGWVGPPTTTACATARPLCPDVVLCSVLVVGLPRIATVNSWTRLTGPAGIPTISIARHKRNGRPRGNNGANNCLVPKRQIYQAKHPGEVLSLSQNGYGQGGCCSPQCPAKIDIKFWPQPSHDNYLPHQREP
jgi:hypothetical protein